MATLTITPAAATYLSGYMTANHFNILKLSLKRSGCTGFKHDIAPFKGQVMDMQCFPIDEQLCIVVENDDLPYLDGTTIDYVQSGFQYTLIFANPQAYSLCGCGKSFSI